MSWNIHLTYIEDLNNVTLEGMRAEEIENWINDIFIPYTKQHFRNNETVVLNNTGGTKILSSLLTQAYQWTEIHYHPYLPHEPNDYIDILVLKDHIIKYYITEMVTAKITPLDHLRLYADKVFELKEISHIAQPIKNEIANLRLAGQFLEKVEDNNYFPAITPVLNDLWNGEIFKQLDSEFKNRKNDKNYLKPKFHKINWERFYSYHSKFDKEEFINFCKYIFSIDEYMLKQLNYDDEGISLPTHLNDKAKKWRKWISGEWFENLIYDWLLEFNIEKNSIQRGLTPANKNNSGYETDILIIQNNQLNFLELKSDIPTDQSPEEFAKQIIIQSQNLGKVKMYLIMSAVIDEIRLKDDEKTIGTPNILKKETFQKHCEDKKIDIVLVKDKNQFKEKLIELKLLKLNT